MLEKYKKQLGSREPNRLIELSITLLVLERFVPNEDRVKL